MNISNALVLSKNVLPWVYFLISPLISFMLVELLNGNFNIFKFKGLQIFLNLVIYYAFYSLFLVVFGNLKIASYIGIIFFSLYGIVNAYIVRFKGSPLLPLDFMSVTTAMNVSGSYNYTPSLMMVVVGVLTILWLLVGNHELGHQVLKLAFQWRLLAGLCCLGFLGIIDYFFFHSTILEREGMGVNPQEQNVGFHKNGVVLSFVDNLSDIIIHQPDDYDVKKINETLQSAGKEVLLYKGLDDCIDVRNIIVIMNESYCDFKTIGDFKTNEDYLGYYHQLDNALKGKTFVSIVGGGTANSEFEFLTGNSYAFLPNGSIAYQMYMKENMSSLVRVLKNEGFYTSALHTYLKSGWNRVKAYSCLGFDQMVFLDDLETTPDDLSRDVPTDDFTYRQVIDIYEKSKSDKNFIYCVTMQNHGGYAFEGYENKVKVLETAGKYPWAEQYLTSLKSADEALHVLVDYFSKKDEPTLILLYGDHQPNVESEFVEYVAKTKLKDFDFTQSMSRYEVPYLLWANYPLDVTQKKDMSLNYLATLLLEAANIKLPPYHRYLNDLYYTYPYINGLAIKDRNQHYHPLSEVKQQAKLKEYESIQYNELFDLERQNQHLYTQHD